MAADLGSASVSPKKPVAAGSFTILALTYVAGSYGIDDQGSIKIAFRDMCDCGRFQWTDPKAPNYVSFSTTGDATLNPSIDPHIRPWRQGLRLKVTEGFLRPGDKIVVVCGDRSQGSPGWRVQTFCEETFEFRVLVDRFGTLVYERLDPSPTIRIVPGESARLVAVAPSVVEVGQPFEVALKAEDKWGNPLGRIRWLKHKGFEEPGTYVIPFKGKKTGFTCEANPIVVEEEVTLGRWWADFHAQSEETVGTNSVEEYFEFARDKALLDIAAHQGNDIQITDEFWARLNRVTREFYQRGKFVTFPGYEWSGLTGVGGDRNVLFKGEGQPISRSSRALVSDDEASFPDSPTANDLFETMKERDCLVFAHVGGRYADLAQHMEGLEFGVEVHSCWGTVEWLLADAFARGYRVGILGNSDGHKGRPGAEYPGASTFGNRGGLTCVLAKRLDRRSIWEALRARHFYATTGPRIFLDVRTDAGALMGDLVESAVGQTPAFLVRVAGTAPIERIEFRNGMEVIKTVRAYGSKDLGRRVKVLWQGARFRGRERLADWSGYVRVRGNRILGFQPINFDSPSRPCVQTKLADRRVRWESVTSGGWAGVILKLGHAQRGTLEIHTAQKDMTVRLKGLGLKGRTAKAGGLGLQLQVYRLPDENRVREMVLPAYRPTGLKKRDNPIYVHVVQEDGHRAWSSPIYLVRR
ncbi:MAG: DUF3604 domain-containing protein [Planctomycetes bacterium]|nr:DUF3604 domain-containing protein [Planctomycetota bacterium]